MKANQAIRNSKIQKNDSANAGPLSGIGATALVIVAVILGAIVGMKVISALMPGFISDGANISENLTTADFGDSTANAIAPIFALLVSLSVLLAIVGLVLFVVSLRRGKGGA